VSPICRGALTVLSDGRSPSWLDHGCWVHCPRPALP
jgi:hypothetical protein